MKALAKKLPTPHTKHRYGSFIRFFDAMPTPKSFDLYIDEQKVAKDVLYEDFTPYLHLESGTHQLKVCAYKKEEPLYERNFWISDMKIYTLVLSFMPHTTELHGYLINEPPKPIPDDRFLMRVANFSEHFSSMTNQIVETKPIFKRIPVRQVGPYLSFEPQTAAMELVDIDNQEVLMTVLPMCFKIYRYYTLYLIGGIEKYPLKWVRTIDGNSFLEFK